MATIQSLNFVPTSISGCSLWLDAADRSSITASVGSVTQWRDKSGQGANMTGTVGPTQGIYNGYPVVSFNGSTQFMNGTTTVPLTTHTLIAIHRPAVINGNNQGNDSLFRFQTGGTYIVFPFMQGTTARGYISSADGTGAGSIDFANSTLVENSVTSAFNIIIAVIASGSQQIYKNGTLQSSNTQSLSGSASPALIIGANNGTNEFYQGDLGEMLVYSSNLSTANRQNIEGYLAWKWGLQASLPTSHPYYYIAPNSAGLGYPSNLRIPVQVQSFLPSSAPHILFNPTSLSGCTLWLDGTSGVTANVWRDKSPLANNATLTSGTITTTTVNGAQALTFANVGMSYANNLIFAGTSGSSCFIIFSVPVVANNHLLSCVQGVNNHLLWVDGILYENIGYSSRQNISGFSYSTVQMYTNIANRTGNTLIFRDGTQIFSNTYGSGYSSLTYSVSWTGTVCEILVYNRTLSVNEQQQIEGYLAWKWGLRSSLPASFPYKNTPPGLPITATIPTSSLQPASFSPRNISGLQIWLDSADTSTISLSGSNVSQWNDKSGNARNATVFNGTPTYSAGNGITFNGSTTLQLTYTGSPSQESLFVIIKFNSVSAQGDILGGSVTGQREYLMYSPYSPGTIYLGRNGSAPSGSVNGGTVTTGTVYQLEYVFDGTGNSITFLQNGTATSTGTPQYTYSAPGTTTYIGSYGSGGYLQGQIYEMIIYNTTLTTLQRQNVEGYLAWKWGLQANLPASHPFKKFAPPPN